MGEWQQGLGTAAEMEEGMAAGVGKWQQRWSGMAAGMGKRQRGWGNGSREEVQQSMGWRAGSNPRAIEDEVWGNEGTGNVADGSRRWRAMGSGDMAWNEALGSQNIWQTVMDG